MDALCDLLMIYFAYMSESYSSHLSPAVVALPILHADCETHPDLSVAQVLQVCNGEGERQCIIRK